jgi:dethiobiotin synthetase
MVHPIFITGIGTGVGKTIAAAVVTEALQSDYWKPVQAGFEEGTDSITIRQLVSNTQTRIHPECYKLQLPASPHIAARQEGMTIDTELITSKYKEISSAQLPFASCPLVIEGAGGIMVPLNEQEFTGDLIAKLQARVILVSRNYLGSINHSLLTAAYCKAKGLDVAGWIFNDQYLSYEQEIVAWSGYPSLGSIPFTERPDPVFIREQATLLQPSLSQLSGENPIF